MWEAKFNCLSVDSKVRETWVALVSRCDCCDKGQVEILDHVLNAGDIAKAVWKWVSLALGVHYIEAQSWWTRINSWFTCVKKKKKKRTSQLGILIWLLPSLIAWKLWGHRCKAHMEGVWESAEEVYFSTKIWLSLLVEGMVGDTKLSKIDHETLKALELPICPKVSKPTLLVPWRKPIASWVKLNVDGSCVGNPWRFGGGGVIRDHHVIWSLVSLHHMVMEEPMKQNCRPS